MNKKIVITKLSVAGAACYAMVTLEQDIPVELQLYPMNQKSLLGNIYIGKVDKVVPQIQGAFIHIKPNFSCYYSLEEHQYPNLKNGQELVVQVCQEALKTKVPKVTSNLNLSGQYLVLTTEKAGMGISSKLDKQTRKNLKNWLEPHVRPEVGVIVRTNASSAEKSEILKELDYLYQRLDAIEKKGKTRTCYSLIEEAVPFYVHGIRDVKRGQLEQIVTDLPWIHEKLQTYLAEYQPEDLNALRFYQDKLLPLYKLYSLEHLLEESTKQKVWLKSGGFLMIQQTEAFVAIDVNSGKYSGRKKAEETYRRINLEAAKEIARQLRLRNLYGIILIDFINMNHPEHQEELLNVLAGYFRQDSVRTRVIDMTKLQITEVTRKKIRKSLQEQVLELKHAKEGFSV